MLDSKDKNTAFSKTFILQCGDNIISLENPVVMGILNLTPDSFYDGGKYQNKESFITRTEQMLEEGAAIIDLGAVSTRPGASEVSEEEEIRRLIPAIIELVKKFPRIVLSIDTYRSGVARIAAENGAGIINDISGGNLDAKMFNTVAGLKIPYVLMHMQGIPATMQVNPQYHDVVHEIRDFFEEKLDELEKSGAEQVIIDPGFGFGKTVEHNFSLLSRIGNFKELNRPILVGLSRKSMTSKLLNIAAKDALQATCALNTIALIHGADILRVHDIKEAVQVIKVVTAMNTSNEKASLNLI